MQIDFLLTSCLFAGQAGSNLQTMRKNNWSQIVNG